MKTYLHASLPASRPRTAVAALQLSAQAYPRYPAPHYMTMTVAAEDPGHETFKGLLVTLCT